MTCLECGRACSPCENCGKCSNCCECGDLVAARGILYGLLLSLPLWIVIVFCGWAIYRVVR